MKVRVITKLLEAECRKRVEEDASSFREDAKMMYELGIGKTEGYSWMQRKGFAGLKKTIQANMLAMRMIGGATPINWEQIMVLMRYFVDNDPFKLLEYKDGVALVEFDDDYVVYVGFSRFKLSDKSARKSVINTIKTVFETSEAEEVAEETKDVEGEKGE